MQPLRHLEEDCRGEREPDPAPRVSVVKEKMINDMKVNYWAKFENINIIKRKTMKIELLLHTLTSNTKPRKCKIKIQVLVVVTQIGDINF